MSRTSVSRSALIVAVSLVTKAPGKKVIERYFYQARS